MSRPEAPAKPGRLGFLDWTRGVAVTIMLQGHVFHSFTKPDLRRDGPFVISQFLGGIGPAIFLVLTGITLGFLMHARERQGLTPFERWKAAIRRAGYLFLLAFLFRFQLWLFAYGQSPWTDLFKVDVLNLMGLAIALLSILSIFTTQERVRLAAGLGVVIAAASPLISALDWSWMPQGLSAYIVPSYSAFSFFPWAAFIAFGVSTGSLLRLVRPEQLNRVMQWVAIFGFACILGGQWASTFPSSLYAKSEFWLDSPSLVFIKLGVVLLLIAVAYLWNEHAANNWSWVRQLGVTSLLVYWVHIELVYGRWFGFWKENLNAWQCGALALVLILLMIGLSLGRTRLGKINIPALFAPYTAFESPRRASGD